MPHARDLLGYEPGRIGALQRETRRSLASLDLIRSSDAACQTAMLTLDRLRGVLSSTVLPAVTAIAARDPLAASRRGRRSIERVDASWYGDWLHGMVETAYREMTDDELLAELVRLEGEVPYDDDFQPDMDDPFWDDFDGLATELAVRAQTDADLARALVENAAAMVLIPFAVEFAGFEPELVAAMLVEVMQRPSAVVDLRSNYQARGAEILMTTLIAVPHFALDVLAAPGRDGRPDWTVVKELIEWPLVDPLFVVALLDAAMAVPFGDPDRLSDAYVVLQHLTELANRRLHESGFPPHVSPVIAQIVVQYLPFFATSLRPGSHVSLKDFELGDHGMTLGRYEAVIDLFGALMRDSESLRIMLGSIAILGTIAAGADHPLDVDTDDLADFVEALDRAARNEQIEEQLREADAERVGAVVIDVLANVARFVSAVLVPAGGHGTDEAIDWAQDGMQALVRWSVSATDLDLDDITAISFLLVAFGVSVGVLRHRDADDDDADDRDLVDTANELVERIEQRLAEGAPIDEVDGLIDDLSRVVDALEPETMAILDDPRITRPHPDVESDLGD